MSFREGLLQARGQIAFLLALVCSTAVIIYLEAFDTQARIRDQVVAEMASGPAAQRSPEFDQAARIAIETARSEFSNLVAHRAAVLNATVLGIAQNLESADVLRQEADKVLTLIEDGDQEQTWQLAPALALLAAAVPEFEPRVVALLGAGSE